MPANLPRPTASRPSRSSTSLPTRRTPTGPTGWCWLRGRQAAHRRRAVRHRQIQAAACAARWSSCSGTDAGLHHDQSGPRRSAARRPRRKPASGAVAVFDAAGKSVLSIGDVDAAGIPALGGEGDPGAAAGRKRRGRSLSASATRNWRWPAPRIRGEPEHVALAADMLAQGGAGRQRARMRRALAVEPGSDRRAGARAAAGRRRCTTIAPESMPASCAAAGICGIDHPGYVGAGPSLPGDGAPRDGGGDRRRARRAQSRHRRLLDPDLCRAAEESGDRLCQDGDRQGPVGRSRGGGEAAVRRLHGRTVLRRRHRAADTG